MAHFSSVQVYIKVASDSSCSCTNIQKAILLWSLRWSLEHQGMVVFNQAQSVAVLDRKMSKAVLLCDVLSCGIWHRRLYHVQKSGAALLPEILKFSPLSCCLLWGGAWKKCTVLCRFSDIVTWSKWWSKSLFSAQQVITVSEAPMQKPKGNKEISRLVDIIPPDVLLSCAKTCMLRRAFFIERICRQYCIWQKKRSTRVPKFIIAFFIIIIILDL